MKKLGLLLSMCVVFGMQQVEAKKKKAAKICTTEQSCVNDTNCQCYCSVGCGFRDKNKNDRPIYVENDPNGKHCYCKPWDYENYNMRQCAAPNPEAARQTSLVGHENAQKGETEVACINNPECKCYCAKKGGYRAKKDGDRPFYAQDKNKCYCNESGYTSDKAQ